MTDATTDGNELRQGKEAKRRQPSSAEYAEMAQAADVMCRTHQGEAGASFGVDDYLFQLNSLTAQHFKTQALLFRLLSRDVAREERDNEIKERAQADADEVAAAEAEYRDATLGSGMRSS
jgi:hypothetical protein